MERNEEVLKLIDDLRDKGIINNREKGMLRRAILLPERPLAKWIPSSISCEDFVCSKCGGGCWYYDVSRHVAKSKFCPNCGADMREE